MAALLKPGGIFHIMVPSLEWAAHEILDKDKASPMLLPLIFGGQENEFMYHRSGFTIPILRGELEKAGLIPRVAQVQPFVIRSSTPDGKITEYKCGENYVQGVKRGPDTG